MNQAEAEIEGGVPDEGWLRDYVEWACTVSMAPREFHLACGLGLVSAIVGNRVGFALGPNRYPPHIWFVLLGKAASKKSSALSAASGVLDQATRGKLRFPRKTTPEAMWQMLSKRASGYMEMSEFGAFLSAAKRDYMAGIREDLCDIFDSPPLLSTQTKGGGEVQIKQPAVTIMAAAVADSLRQWVSGDDLAGGFLSRFLFVPQVSEGRYIGMTGAPEDDYRRLALVDRLEAMSAALIQDHPGIVTISFEDGPRKYWERYDRSLLRQHVPGSVSGFVGRAGLYAAKLSMLYAIAERGSPKVTEADVARATTLVEVSRRYVLGHASSMDRPREAGDVDRLVRKVDLSTNGNGWAHRRDVMRSMGVPLRRFEEWVRAAVELDLLEEDELPPPAAGGKPIKLLRLRITEED